MALTPGVSPRCQATSRCQLMLSVCGQTHPSECRLQNNNNNTSFGPCVTFVLRCFQSETSCWRHFVMLTQRQPLEGGSDVSDSSSGTNV